MKRNTFLSRLAILAISCYSTSCLYKELPTGFDCAQSDLGISLVSKQDASSCKSIDGRIEMAATGGLGAYDFSLGDGVYQTNPVFDRLAPGSYLVTVKDLNNCKKSVHVELAAANSNLAASTSATPDDQCLSNNGSITVTPSGGVGPYELKIDNGTFAASTTFNNLSNGNHSIILRDHEDCERVLIVTVPRGSTGISYTAEIVPIFNANCNFSGCHGAGTTGRDWTNFNDVKAKANDIKMRTANRSMPIGGNVLTADQIQKIGCWVDDGANQN
jgi:hypothetical protein